MQKILDSTPLSLADPSVKYSLTSDALHFLQQQIVQTIRGLAKTVFTFTDARSRKTLAQKVRCPPVCWLVGWLVLTGVDLSVFLGFRLKFVLFEQHARRIWSGHLFASSLVESI